MKIHTLSLALFLALLAGAGCNPPVKPDQVASGADTSAVVLKEEEVAPVPAVVPLLDDSYEMMGNMEFVQYCLPYPKAEFSEDYDLSEGKGQHVFVSKDKQSRITYSGNMLDMSFDDLYAACLKDIKDLTGAAPLKQQKERNAFSLAWKEAGKNMHMKKWFRETEKETVTVKFEYPDAQSQKFTKWIADITAQPTVCE